MGPHAASVAISERCATVHENDTKKVAQFKVEAMDRGIERLYARFEHLMHKLYNFQEQHMQ
jgi:hypothetical protein